MSERFEISKAEYQQKKYEISKDILSNIMTLEYIEKGVESKRRVNLIFNCMMIATGLMEEMGYVVKGATTEEGSRVRNLNDILNNISRKDDDE